jgi:hypothetical protein
MICRLSVLGLTNVTKEKFAQTIKSHAAHIAGRNDSVGVDVIALDWNSTAGDLFDGEEGHINFGQKLCEHH